MEAQYSIYYLVLSDGTKPVPIQVEPTTTIGELATTIWQQEPCTASQFGVSELKLYRVDASGINERMKVQEAKRIMRVLKLEEKLDQSLNLSALYPSAPPEGVIHIVVQLPDENVNEPMPKRRKIGTTPEAAQFTDYHRQYWGNPLDSALTTLPTYVTDLDGLELDNEEDTSGDVLPGKPFLDAFETRFLVRAEYIRAFDGVKAVYDTSRNTHLAVVTGQPGIGKTLWINYAMRRCLGEKQPVIWYLNREYHLFSSSGVDIYTHVNQMYRQHPLYTWCFVDSTHADRLPTAIYNPLYNLFPVYVTSPKQERWAKLYQLRLPELIIMNPWTMVELEKAAVLYPERNSDDIFERFDNAGPSARLCLEYSSAEISQFYAARDMEISLDTTERFVATLLNEKGLLCIGDISHQLCVIRRSDSETSEFVVEPISSFIRHRLLTQIWKWTAQDRDNMIRRFSRVPGAGGITGVLFESQYQRRFAEKIDIVAAPMFRTSNPHSLWHVEFGDFSAFPMLYKAQEEALSTVPPLPTISLSISPSELRIYEHSGLLTIEENIYYVSLSENEVAIDSFIVHAGHLYLFQFASGPQHSVNRGLLTTLARFSGLPAAENQHFIFVVPKHLAQFNCPHSNDGFLRDHVPYVAQIDN